MMVARSFQYSSPNPTKSPKQNERGSTVSDHRQRSVDPGKTEWAKSLNKSPKMFTPPPPTPSRPVVIPTRSGNDGRRKSRESASRDQNLALQSLHDPSTTPPSMAALLAMNDRPQSKKPIRPEIRRKETYGASRRISNAKLRETPKVAMSTSSPQSWDMLLSPPEDSGSEASTSESDTTLGPPSSFRSLSTESMPSLDTDNESLASTSNPATPDLLMGSRGNTERRQKSISTSVGEDCALDHPLLFPAPARSLRETTQDGLEDFETQASPPARSKSSFKSNLTAGFRKIRSAAQSFSAVTAPPTQREDYLARTFLSMGPPFSDEIRPLPSTDPPDPALRRYLNPLTFSPAELHFHSKDSLQSSCTASIQLQTYQRRSRNFDKASSPPVFTSAQQKALDAVDGLPQASSPRQREPRENSDFLRVIVLEMNMRKKGKLSDASPGRARLWLPARQVGKGTEECESGEGKVPTRWVGMLA